MAVISGTLAHKKLRTQILDMTYRDLYSEKMHLKFCKYVIGVHSKAPSLPTIGELGRFRVDKSFEFLT